MDQFYTKNGVVQPLNNANQNDKGYQAYLDNLNERKNDTDSQSEEKTGDQLRDDNVAS